MPFAIAEDGTVAPSFRPRPVVHAEHLWSDSDQERHGAHESQQRVVARRHREMTSETRAGFPAERRADPGEGGIEGMTAPSTGSNESGEALGEGSLTVVC